MALNVVLMGTGEFALPTFAAMMESGEHNVVGLYTQPDRTGRGHHRHVNKVKELAIEHDVPVFQPTNVNAPETLDELRQLSADVFLVAAYGQIMKNEFLAIPPLGAFNLHGSLLPRHRGAAPVQYSIWKGDAEGGVTIFQIERGLDSGPMIGKVSTPIGEHETSGELMIRLAEMSVGLSFEALRELESGTAVFESQDPGAVTLAPKIAKEAGIIDWNQSAAEIQCQIRAMQPWPKASSWLHCDARKPMRCLLLKSVVTEGSGSGFGSPGTIRTGSSGLEVATGNGILQVEQIQPEGKKAMDGTAFLNGYGVKSGLFRSTDA